MLSSRVVIVYGTLRYGEGNYNWALTNATPLALGDRVKGWAMRAFSGYPAVFEGSPSSEVVVDVFDLEDDEDTMRAIDSMEFGAWYARTYIRTEGGIEGWMYYMPHEQAMQFPDPVPSGDWMEYKANRNERGVI